ncbi:MAG TPA: TetR/AcrR family transcriptional regulator [Flavipsychrobacter sp.]|nr:TetR/AcrR family transcriptional regulator [Flavipsychrobacter sp.]
MKTPDVVYSNIISRAARLFARYGYKRITLDDVSTECGISKKTFYTFFDNKTDLVKKVVTYELELFQQEVDLLQAQSGNAVEEQLRLIEVVHKLSFRLTPTLRNDLIKFYQDAFQLIEDFKEHYLLPFFKKNMKKGLSEGLYRDFFNPKIMIYLRMEQLEALAYKTFTQPTGISIEEIIRQVNYHYLSGLCTPNGFKILKKHIHSNNINSHTTI